jgi:hypothetical protein
MYLPEADRRCRLLLGTRTLRLMAALIQIIDDAGFCPEARRG